MPLHILTLVLSACAPHPDVHKHTLCNLSQEGGGSATTVPPPPTVPDRAVFTSPSLSLTHSLTLPIVLTLSVFPTHACSVADGTDEGSASVSAPPPRPLQPGRQWCVITEQWLAEWSDWWGDCGLLTGVFVWPIDMCSHWHTGTGDKPQWAQTAVGQSSLNRMQRSPSITPSHPPAATLPSFISIFRGRP